jgi:hypothetical protein
MDELAVLRKELAALRLRVRSIEAFLVLTALVALMWRLMP